MTDISYKINKKISDTAIEQAIGYFIQYTRKQQQLTQTDVAQAAQISRSTLSLLERGETVTLGTLIKVLRVLGQLQTLQTFEVQKQISPLALAKLQQKERQRVRKSINDEQDKQTDW